MRLESSVQIDSPLRGQKTRRSAAHTAVQPDANLEDSTMSIERLQVAIAICAAIQLVMAQGSVAAGTKRALLIGISHYVPDEGAKRKIPPGYHPDSRFDPNYSWKNLPAPPDDADRMKRLVLKDLYGFDEANIRVLPEAEATRVGILKALDKLADDSQPGDTVVFYFAGHGSRRLDSDTLSESKTHMDQTIVPIDAWQGIPDVRDKELAVPFNRIVYDKKAHLTAIFDSCDSAMQARGLSPVISRALAYDDRDVAVDKNAHPDEVVVESDLKRIPQNGNAVILAAAGPDQSAIEAKYPDDGEWHGAFTRALIRTLQASPQLRSADDVVLSVQAQLRADSNEHPEIGYQQISVEGRHDQSLFGAPLPPHPLHAVVTTISSSEDSKPIFKLDIGSVGGFDVGTVFRALDPASDGNKTELTVTSLDKPMVSSAVLLQGSHEVKVGQVFELSRKVYPHAAQLAVFVSIPGQGAEGGTDRAKALFPGLQWVDDPSLAQIDYLVVHEDRGWVAYKCDGTALPAGETAKGAAYLVPPPPQRLIDRLKEHQPYINKAYAFTNRLVEANYILTTRMNGYVPEFALMDLSVLAPRGGSSFIHTPSSDPAESGKLEESDLDVQLSHFGPNEKLSKDDSRETVCRLDEGNIQKNISLPIRTAWLHDVKAAGLPEDGCDHDLAYTLTRRIVRLGKVRWFLNFAAQAPNMPNWPYRLTLTKPGTEEELAKSPSPPAQQYVPLHRGDRYEVRLEATAGDLALHDPDSKYLYLYFVDCAGDLQSLYPPDPQNGVDDWPKKVNDSWPSSKSLFALISPDVEVGKEQTADENGVSNPLGVDSFFLLALPPRSKRADPASDVADGNLCELSSKGATTRGVFSDLDSLQTQLNDESAGNKKQADWTVQKIVVPSRPK